MNIHNSLEDGKFQLIENIKILLYKQQKDVFEYLDFENDCIYEEPLFFAHFKDIENNNEKLESLVYGYIELDKYPKIIKVESDKHGRIYLPNIGWLITKHYLSEFNLKGIKKLELYYKDRICEYEHESISYIKNTNIELLKYPVPILKQFYYDEHLNKIDVEIEEITKKHFYDLTKAFQLIKKHVPDHFKLIESVTKKVVVFNVSDNLRNSFATLSAHGIAFFNACQENYNEVFFIDDIAHQTGHIIFNTLIYDIEKFLKIKPTYIVQELKNEQGKTVETRDIHVLFHALYTYYTTFICLDAMLDNNVFEGEKLHEILGRMKFYIVKCFLDLKVIDNQISNDEDKKLFTSKGLEIYSEIKNKHQEMSKKWLSNVKGVDLHNQPYNFTYSKFVQLNPLYENNN